LTRGSIRKDDIIISKSFLVIAIISIFFLRYSADAMASDNDRHLRPITTRLDPGQAQLAWTATGDDGGQGQATGYDLRYQSATFGPIDTEQEWEAASQVYGEPLPGVAGSPQSMIVSDLGFGEAYYFCIKAFDNVLNYSNLSNSPFVVTADTSDGDFIPGDANNDNAVNGLDVIYLVNYLKGGPEIPDPILRADANGSCIVGGLDVIYIVRFLHGGPPPHRGDCN